MTAEGHLIFSVACAIFAKKAEVTPELATGDWWHIIPAALLTSLLPDIDHPKSVLGQRLRWIALPIARAFGHRGFTHSLLAIAGGMALFQLDVPRSWPIGRRAARHDHRLLQPSAGRYAHSRRRSAAVAMPLAFSPAAAQLAKGNQLSASVSCLCHRAICWQGFPAGAILCRTNHKYQTLITKSAQLITFMYIKRTKTHKKLYQIPFGYK